MDATAHQINIVISLVCTMCQKFLFQERDEHAPTWPRAITTFGGHVERGENLESAITRELKEELSIDISPQHFAFLGVAPAHALPPGAALFAAWNIDRATCVLREGKRIIEVETLDELLAFPNLVPNLRNRIRELQIHFVDEMTVPEMLGYITSVQRRHS